MVWWKGNLVLYLKAVKTTQVEKKDWKNHFLIAYRHSTQHSRTGGSPAELLFNRNIQRKLPKLSEVRENVSGFDRDAEMKQKCKDYVKRNAK